MPGLTAFAASVLGPCETVADHTWDHGASAVLRVRDETGREWVVKRHGERERYEAELAAYQRWTPRLGSGAASLRSHDDARQAVLLTALPGEPGPWPGEPETHRRAGALLRLLHEAETPMPWPEFATAKLAEYEALLPTAGALLDADVLGFVRSELLAFPALGTAPLRVPCHRDYTPRNWLVSPAGVHVIDFELARPDVWVNDLTRLESGPWRGRPDLRAAFLSGYGREPGPADEAASRVCRALTALWLVVKAREYAQPDLEAANRQALRNFMNRGR